MEFGSPHFLLKFVFSNDCPEKLITSQKNFIFEENIMDSDYPRSAQQPIIDERAPLTQGPSDCEMRIVIKVRTRTDQPVNKTSLK
jgi:hypothetical protein